MTELMQLWPKVSMMFSKIKNKNCVLVINNFTNYRDKVRDITVLYKTKEKDVYELRQEEKSMYVLTKPIPITVDMLKSADTMWTTIKDNLRSGHENILSKEGELYDGDFLEELYKNNLIRKMYPDTDEYI